MCVCTEFRLPAVLPANFSFLRRSPVDIMPAIFEQIPKLVIAVTQFFRSCGSSVRPSVDQPSPRREGRTQGSEGLLMAKEEGHRFPPVGTDQADPSTPPIVLGMTVAGERRK